MVHKTQQDLQFIREHQNLQKPEQYLHVVHPGRQGTQYLAGEQKHLDAGPIHNLVKHQFFGSKAYNILHLMECLNFLV